MTPPRLTHLYVNPSDECNLACAHCWVSPDRSGGGFAVRDRHPREFGAETLGRLLAEAGELGLARVKFTGSEPLLRSDFAELYRAAAECPASPGLEIETNGTLEPPGLWEALAARPPDMVSVSLDSTDPEVHDRFRGAPGAWERSLAFLRRLTDAGFATQVIMSVAETEIEPVIRMARLCRELRVGSLKINPVQPIGRGRGLLAGGERAAALIDFSRRLFTRLGRSVVIDVPPAFVPLDRLASQPGCPLLHLLGVLPDGGISLCGIGFSCPDLVMGTFPADRLEEVWRSSPVLERLRGDVSARLGGICADCIHRDSCMGKCVMQNYSASGCFTAPFWLCAEADRAGLFPPTRRAGGHAEVHPQG